MDSNFESRSKWWYNISRLQNDSVGSKIPPPKPLVTLLRPKRSKSGQPSPTHAPTFPRNTGQASSLTVTSRISPVCADFCVKWPI